MRAEPRLWRRARGPLSTVLDQAVVAGANFFILILLARRLPPETFGAYVVGLASLNAFLGLHGAAVTFPLGIHGTAGPSEPTLAYMRGAGRLHLIQAIGVAAICFVVASALPPAAMWTQILLLVALLEVPYQLNDYIRRLLLTRDALTGLLRYDAVSSLARVVAVYLLVSPTTASVLLVAAALAAGFFLGFLSHLAFDDRKHWVAGRTGGQSSSAISVMRRNWPLTRLMLPEVVAYQASTQAMVMLSTAFLPAVQVAALGALQGVANVINVLLAGLTNHGFASLTRALHREDVTEWQATAGFMSILAIASSGLCGLAFVIAPQEILQLFYGTETYLVTYSPLLRLFAIVVMVRTLSVLLITILRSRQVQKDVTAATVTSAVVVIVTAPPLMTLFGLVGAVGGLLLAQSIIVLKLTGPALREWSQPPTGSTRAAA